MSFFPYHSSFLSFHIFSYLFIFYRHNFLLFSGLFSLTFSFSLSSLFSSVFSLTFSFFSVSFLSHFPFLFRFFSLLSHLSYIFLFSLLSHLPLFSLTFSFFSLLSLFPSVSFLLHYPSFHFSVFSLLSHFSYIILLFSSLFSHIFPLILPSLFLLSFNFLEAEVRSARFLHLQPVFYDNYARIFLGVTRIKRFEGRILFYRVFRDRQRIN